MKKTYLFVIFAMMLLKCSIWASLSINNSKILIETKKIDLEDFPEAFNPSIVKIETGFLLTFRHCLAPLCPWVSHIGIVKLDHDLNVVSKPHLLNTREEYSLVPSQAEDARIFSFNNKIFVIYNDNQDILNPSTHERRDMFIAEVQSVDDQFILSKPLKITHEKKYDTVNWQKNWVPFQWNNQLLMSYSLSPHEVLAPNLSSGISKTLYNIRNDSGWNMGVLRGGTPALLVDDQYLGFFHSSIVTQSEASNGQMMHHYFMGAYTFSKKPPFNLKKISPSPIIAEDFYTQSSFDKRVIFPGGFAIMGQQFYVAYGKDDSEIWIAKIDKKTLMQSLKRIKK